MELWRFVAKHMEQKQWMNERNQRVDSALNWKRKVSYILQVFVLALEIISLSVIRGAKEVLLSFEKCCRKKHEG